MKELANEIVAWLKDYAVKNNRKTWVVGVSGGIDSALVSTLCAMTGMPTHCVILPCHSKSNETTRGRNHVQWLLDKYDNVQGNKWDLSSVFDAFKCSLPDDNPDTLALANSKSRLRMIALYQVATPLQGLVVGTGNKVEDFGVGFFTKYGDGGVDISPIADLTKTEVRAMARALDINKEILEVAPTDGLWDDARTDEQALGASYEELEWAMDHYEEWMEGLLNTTQRQKEVLVIYNKWHTAGQHKLNPIPMFKRKA